MGDIPWTLWMHRLEFRSGLYVTLRDFDSVDSASRSLWTVSVNTNPRYHRRDAEVEKQHI